MRVQFEHAALLGFLALLLLPVIAHLMGSREVPRFELPTVRFLLQAQQTLRRRWHLDDTWLLLARLLALAAAVLLFARPVLHRPVRVMAGPLPAVDTVLVVDRSLSTRSRDGRMQEGRTRQSFDGVRERALEVLDQLDPGARVGLVWMDHRGRPAAGGLTLDRGGLRQALRAAEPGFGGTDLEPALRQAALLLGGSLEGHVIVLGDGTASALPGAPPEEWRPGLALTVEDLAGPGEGLRNRTVLDVVVEDPADPALGVPLEVIVAGAGAVGGDRVTIDLEIEGLDPIRGTLEGGDRKRFLAFDPPPGLVPGTAVLGADDLPDDDRTPFFLTGSRALRVHLVGGQAGSTPREDELYYAVTALRPGPGAPGEVEPVVLDRDAIGELPARPGTVLVLANAPATEKLAREVQRLLDGGAGVLVAAGSLVDRDRYRALLGPVLPAFPGAVKARDGSAFEAAELGLAAPDITDPLWEPFAEGGRSTFPRARFEQVMEVEPRLEPGSRVLLRYTDGRAALLERAVGPGRLILYTSTLDDDWNDLPIRPIYTPILHQLVRYLAGDLERSGGDVVFIGERPSIPLPPSRRGAGLEVHGPDDRIVPVELTGDPARPVLLPAPDRPGHYRLVRPTADGGEQVHWRYCARIDPAESARTPLDPMALADSFPDAVFVRGADGGTASVVRRSSLVPWLVLLVLAGLGLEALLGRRR